MGARSRHPEQRRYRSRPAGAPYDPLSRAKLRDCLAGLGPTICSDRGGSISEQPLVFSVQLDGRRISALFDTGAQFSVLSTRTALALGVSEGVLARDPAVMVRGADGEQLSAHAHRFFRLEVDGEVIRNAEIDVTEINLNDADFLLGIDFLGSQRVWISYGSQQLFLMRRI